MGEKGGEGGLCTPTPPRLEGPSPSIPCEATRDTAGWEHEGGERGQWK